MRPPRQALDAWVAELHARQPSCSASSRRFDGGNGRRHDGQRRLPDKARLPALAHPVGAPSPRPHETPRSPPIRQGHRALSGLRHLVVGAQPA